jgi:hypothetical protein
MDDVYVIWSFEHDAWWGPARWGYTPDLANAGRYSQHEAAEIVEHANIVKINERMMTLAEAERWPS